MTRSIPDASSLRHRLARFANTLKFRVVLVAVASALVSGGASTFLMSREGERVAGMLFMQQQSGEVELLAGVLNSKVQQIQANLAALASEVSPEMADEPPALEVLLRNRPAARLQFEVIFVLAPDGRSRALMINGEVQRDGFSAADRDYFQQALATRQPVVSDPVQSRVSGRPLVIFAHPLMRAGKVYAVVCAALPLASRTLLPATLSEAGKFDSSLVVFARTGQVLSHTDMARQLAQAGDEPGLAEVYQEWVTDGRTVFSEAITRSVPGYMVALAGVPAAQWMVARMTPRASALEALRAVQRRSWLVVVAIMVLCAAAAGVLVAWMTRPIERLRDRAEQLLGSDAPQDAGWPRARGEIGDLVRVFREVTIERARASASQRTMAEQLRALLQHASIGIILTRDRRFELMGHHMTRLLGYTEDELIGQPARLIYPSDEAYAELGQRVGEQMKRQGFFDGEVVFRRKDGSEFWGQMLGRGLVPGDPAAGTIWIINDITAAREAKQQLSWSASHDSLTHLVNRREFETRLAQVLADAATADACAMFVDLDRFKAINDGAGHAAGDEALRQIARLLEQRVRQSDTVGRIGGDEFGILLPGCRVLGAREIAEQIRAAVEDWELDFRGKRFQVGASIGIVAITADFADTTAVLGAADAACYAAKHGGRNQVVVYDAGLEAAPIPEPHA